MMSRSVGLGVHRSAVLLLSAALCTARECNEGDRHCYSDSVDDASLLSIHKLRPHDVPQHPAISSSRRPPTLQVCSVGDSVECPHSGSTCAGDECCPGASDNITFPCPSASEGFAGCGSNVKVSDCVRHDGRGSSSPSTVAGAELATSGTYGYGKFEASIQYAGADGVISSFFLWKPTSEKSSVYWNELDYEKLGTDWNGECKMQLNLINGMPGPVGHEQLVKLSNICAEFHTYAFEWTPDYVRYTVDGVEVRKIMGWDVDQFNQNAGSGAEFHFNLWPGDWSFGGNFQESSLPLYQYIDWVRYSSYSGPGSFTREWQEDFNCSSMPEGWYAASWNSPLGYSAHRPENIVFTGSHAVLALTHAGTVPTAASIPPP